MLDNELFTNKYGEFSKWKDFWGRCFTVFWDNLQLFFLYTSIAFVLVLIFLSIKQPQPWFKPTIISILVVFPFVYIINFITYKFVEPYIYTRKIDAKQPDRKGLLYAILSLNLPMFFLIWSKLDKQDRELRFPTYSPKKERVKKAKKTKTKSAKQEKPKKEQKDKQNSMFVAKKVKTKKKSKRDFWKKVETLSDKDKEILAGKQKENIYDKNY